MQSFIPQAKEEREALLYEVISEIQSQSTDCTWFVSSDTLISILSIRKEDYYRQLYSLRSAEFNPASLRGFHESEADYLCILLNKLLKIEKVELEFAAAGIYFAEESLFDFRETFITLLKNSLDKHKLDKELLILLSSATISFDDAFDSYFDDKFEMDTLIERTINTFMNVNSIDPYYGAEVFLRKYLRDQILYKKIKLFEIKEEYKERYFYELYGRVRKRKKHPLRKYPREIQELFDFFGLDGSADRKALKTKYAELLKIYHPDLNKNGLEKTKIIIENYKKLHSFLES